jgi:hypothetical protein
LAGDLNLTVFSLIFESQAFAHNVEQGFKLYHYFYCSTLGAKACDSKMRIKTVEF